MGGTKGNSRIMVRFLTAGRRHLDSMGNALRKRTAAKQQQNIALEPIPKSSKATWLKKDKDKKDKGKEPTKEASCSKPEKMTDKKVPVRQTSKSSNKDPQKKSKFERLGSRKSILPGSQNSTDVKAAIKTSHSTRSTEVMPPEVAASLAARKNSGGTGTGTLPPPVQFYSDVMLRQSSMAMPYPENTSWQQDIEAEMNMLPKSQQRSKAGPVLTVAQIELIKEIWETSKHGEIGSRIYTRLLQKRADIKATYQNMEVHIPEFSWRHEARQFNEFLHDIVKCIDCADEFEMKCREWGQSFSHLREYGFKPHIWVPFSEIMTTECIYLDAGVHPIADIVDAWATFNSIMLTNMRDGFYNGMRLKRRISKRRQTMTTSQSGYAFEVPQQVTLGRKASMPMRPTQGMDGQLIMHVNYSSDGEMAMQYVDPATIENYYQTHPTLAHSQSAHPDYPHVPNEHGLVYTDAMTSATTVTAGSTDPDTVECIYAPQPSEMYATHSQQEDSTQFALASDHPVLDPKSPTSPNAFAHANLPPLSTDDAQIPFDADIPGPSGLSTLPPTGGTGTTPYQTPKSSTAAVHDLVVKATKQEPGDTATIDTITESTTSFATPPASLGASSEMLEDTEQIKSKSKKDTDRKTVVFADDVQNRSS